MFFARKKSWHVVEVTIPQSESQVALDAVIGKHTIRCLETSSPVFIGSDDGADIPIRHREPMQINADSRDVYVRAPHGDAIITLILDD